MATDLEKAKEWFSANGSSVIYTVIVGMFGAGWKLLRKAAQEQGKTHPSELHVLRGRIAAMEIEINGIQTDMQLLTERVDTSDRVSQAGRAEIARELRRMYAKMAELLQKVEQ